MTTWCCTRSGANLRIAVEVVVTSKASPQLRLQVGPSMPLISSCAWRQRVLIPLLANGGAPRV
jgi:hypothetical protein